MKTAKVFMSGKSQAIRLPKEFRFDTREVYIKKAGKVVMLSPKEDAWEIMFNSLSKFSEDFMEERHQPEEQVREELFE